MATRTWNGTTTSAWGTAANWNENAVPTSSDDVILTGSNACHLAAGSECKSLTCTGYTGTLTGTDLLFVFGNCTLAAGMTIVALNLVFNANGTLIAAGKKPLSLKADQGAVVTLGGDVTVTSYAETSAADSGFDVAGHVLTVETHADDDGIYLDHANSWAWSAGGKVVVKTTGAQVAVIYVDGTITPSLPPVEIDATAGGSVVLHDADLVCDTFAVTGGTWDPNGFDVIETGGAGPAYAAAAQPGFWD